MKWRPSGWVNPNKILTINPVPEGSDPTAFTAYEEGADAMLKAIKEHLGEQVLFPPKAVQSGAVWIDERSRYHVGDGFLAVPSD